MRRKRNLLPTLMAFKLVSETQRPRGLSARREVLLRTQAVPTTQNPTAQQLLKRAEVRNGSAKKSLIQTDHPADHPAPRHQEKARKLIMKTILNALHQEKCSQSLNHRLAE